MGRWVRRAAVFLVLLLASAGVAMPAWAGGPTSVLLSAPGIPRVVATGYEDPEYNDLMKLVDVSGPGAAPVTEDHAGGRFIRATWLIHDMSVWRLDIIYPDAPGGPWIATTMDQSGSGKMPEKPIWHRPTDPQRLLQVLVSLGLLGNGPEYSGGPTSLPGTGSGDDSTGAATGDSYGTTDGSVAAGANGSDNAGSTAASSQSADKGVASLSGWRWIIPGFLLGAILAAVGTRYWLPRRGRWELIDAE